MSILVSKPVIEICQTTTAASNSTTEGPMIGENISFISDPEMSNSSFRDDNQIDCQMKVTLAVTFVSGVLQVIKLSSSYRQLNSHN